MTIHKEGLPSIAAISFLSALMLFSAFYFFSDDALAKFSLIVFTVFLDLMILQFFRKPERKISPDENLVFSPADGKVVAIEEVLETEYFNEKKIQVSIFMSPMNVHINWNPVGGKVKYAKYHAGLYLVAWHPKSSTENERATFVIQTKNNAEILFRQIAGALARRIIYYIKEGDIVKQGDEMGFIKFGSRVDILLPMNAKIKVSLNEKVKGCETKIAELF